MEGAPKQENSELEENFQLFEVKGHAYLNDIIDLLLDKKFPGVEQESEEIENDDPHYQAKHDAHMDDMIYEEVGKERKLKFKDLVQKNEFHRLVEVLKNSGEENDKLLREIGYVE